MPAEPRNYGWKQDKPDIRDFHFEQLVKLKALRSVQLPSKVSLRQFCSPVMDQGNLGACTAHALTSLLEYNERARNGAAPPQDLSRLFVYYNERVLEGTVHEDAGAELRTGIKVLAAQGVCAETDWPYIVEKFDANPPPACYQSGVATRIHSYYSLRSLNEMRTAIANGRPFVFGFMAYDSFESDEVAASGILNMPTDGEEPLGGHAVMAIGYDDEQKRFLIKNSWGVDWGLKDDLGGYFTIPFDYLTNPGLSSDFWTIVKDA